MSSVSLVCFSLGIHKYISVLCLIVQPHIPLSFNLPVVCDLVRNTASTQNGASERRNKVHDVDIKAVRFRSYNCKMGKESNDWRLDWIYTTIHYTCAPGRKVLVKSKGEARVQREQNWRRSVLSKESTSKAQWASTRSHICIGVGNPSWFV
jgi:hypothetical protein